MAKTKTKKGTADRVRFKKAPTTQKTNPFEVKINKQKHDILGKKVEKYAKGMPGVSRFKAIKKRKETLLVEYKKRGKTNRVVDRRFGENDADMTLEDKMLQRFALERQRGHEKSNLFNLNEEDEELTHYGQSLSQIEKFENPLSSDEDDDEGGKIGADMVAEEHFGGFLTRKKPGDDDKDQKSWKVRMEEIIVKSKKQKYERQSEKEKTTELTDKLDEEWKDLRFALATSKRSKDTIEQSSKADDYDIMVRKLQFDLKGKATDRMKTEEELAKEEEERLQKLEADRLRRMKGITESEDMLEKAVFRSADDLDDGFDLDGSKNKRVSLEVAYRDGKPLVSFDSEEQKASDNEEESEDDENSVEAESSEEDEDESDSDDPMKHTSDLESSADEQDAEDDDKNDSNSEAIDEKQTKLGDDKRKEVKGILKPKTIKISGEEAKDRSKKKKEVMEAAREELPYTFPAPDSYEDLLKLLEGHEDRNQLVIVDRLQKLYHPSLAEGNKDKLQTLYGLLLQYYSDLALQDPPMLTLADGLVKPIYQLTQQFPAPAASTWAQILKERLQDFSQIAQRKGGRGIYPELDVLMWLKLVSVLFPTSDFRHRVVTPAMLFMGEILSQCPVQSPRDIASGLFLTGLFLEYVSFAKRLVPEAINFLSGLLFLSIEKEPNKIESVSLPFKPVGKNIDLLKLKTKCKHFSPGALKLQKIFSSDGNDFLDSEEFKVCAMYQVLILTREFKKVYENLPSVMELFKPVIYFLKKLPVKRYPDEIQMLHKEVVSELETLAESVTLTHLVRPKQRPKPLQMFEPKFDDHFDGKKKRGGSREFLEKQKLVSQLKKETKGAMRNLRQDNQFIARQKLHEQMERDSERKRKVKALLADLSSQEGDYKALKRLKDKV